MVIIIDTPLFNGTGKVLFVRTNLNSIFFPLCLWVQGYFGRVSSLLSWKPTEKGTLQFLIETNDGIQILIELDVMRGAPGTFHNLVTFDSQVYIPIKTSDIKSNGQLWLNQPLTNKSNYSFANLVHFTENKFLPDIFSSKQLRFSKWNLSGTKKLETVNFCYLTDNTSIKYAWDFFNIAMVREKYPENLFCETDDGVIIPWNIYKVTKKMDAHVDFQVDLRLVALNPIIHHFKDNEEWWEVFMPRVYRIACNHINLTGTNEPFKVTEDSINGYKICKGFLMAEGSDFYSM